MINFFLFDYTTIFFPYLDCALQSALQQNDLKNNFINHTTYPFYADVSWLTRGLKIEKSVEFWSLELPNSMSIWSTLDIHNYAIYYICIILSLPIVNCFLLVFFFLKNHMTFTYFGALPFMDEKIFNFTYLFKNYWWTLWSYGSIFVNWYGASEGEMLHSGWNYPNPRAALSFFWHIFLIRHRPHYLSYWLYFFFILLMFFFQDFGLIFALIFSYFMAFYLYNRWRRSRWSLGLIYHKWIIFKLRKNIDSWENFLEKLHLWFWIIFYPLFLSFILFFLVTLFVIFMYFNFFFNPITTWNGYFSNTIISFFVSVNVAPDHRYFYVPLDYLIAFDGLNVWLIWLTSLLVFLCTMYLLETVNLWTFFAQMSWIYLLAFASFQFFCVPNYLWMYIYFELSLLPIFLLIVYWGSNWWKIHAAYQMVLFTFVGSLFLLSGIFLLFIKIRSFNCFDIFLVTQSNELSSIFSSFEKKLIWLFLFFGFAVKTPLYPFHIWLPEAHSEAPTTGSVMLAGVLLKMGTYGFLRFVIPLFPTILETFKTLVFSMCLCGILLSSLAALAQVDIKKIIAYSSIGHMGLVIIGIYTLNMNGLLGASYMMLSHGLISSALFFSIGILYKIYGTWSIIYYNSIAHFMPWFSMCFFIFSLANMGFPGTAGFPGELLIFTSMMADNFFLSIFVGFGSVLGGVYSIWLLTWVLYGQISPKIAIYRDLKSSERKVLNFLLILIIVFGVCPFIVLDFLKPMCVFFSQLT